MRPFTGCGWQETHVAAARSANGQHGVQHVDNGLALRRIVAHDRRPMKRTALGEQPGRSNEP